MKRLAAITLLIALLLCACGKPSDTPTPTPTPDSNVSIPVSTPTPEAPVYPEVEGMLCFDGIYFEPRGEVDDAAVNRFADKLTTLKNKHFADNKVYYALIPDKSWYFRDRTDEYFDHQYIADSLSGKLEGFTAIDLSGTLTGSDFYATDPHWKQENLSATVSALAEAMGFTYTESDYTANSAGTFIGTGLSGKEASGVAPDTLYYLTSDVIDAAKVDNFQQQEFTKVYDLAKFGTNGYDVFL